MSRIAIYKTRTPRTNRAKAVALAKDVIKHLDDFKNIIVGKYVEFVEEPGSTNEFKDLNAEKDVQEIIEPLSKKCEVCALGACFLSYIRLYDNVKFDSFYLRPSWVSYPYVVSVDGFNLKNKLLTVFSKSQMFLIESAFEKKDMIDDCNQSYVGMTKNKIDDAVEFGRRYTSPRSRLLNIMKNIVTNNGMFVP
ncbi:hypothetical protein C4577_02895 [Candidatus Parcubacteria bacterium]|nr:MAG: hypothetical protein C4577_02895 [Candidatus Parcubacteria bacterium]